MRGTFYKPPIPARKVWHGGAVIADSQQFTDKQAAAITGPVRAAYDRIRSGGATADDLLRVASAVNIAFARAKRIGSSDFVQGVLMAAGEALKDCETRHASTGVYGLTGIGLHQVDAGMEAYETIVAASSVRDMQLAVDDVFRELRREQEPAT